MGSTKLLQGASSRPWWLLPPATLIAALAASPALAADPPLVCKTSFDPYKASDATRQACGIKSFPRDKKITLPDGSTEYRYVVEGMPVKYLLPPPGFDPLVATPAERKRFGIPNPPTEADPVLQAGYRELMAKLHFVTPPDELLEVPVRAYAQTSTQIWAGYMNAAGPGAWTEALGQYVEPTAGYTPCGGDSAVFWSGIGGFWNDTVGLAQDGTAIHTPTVGEHQAWWEIWPDNYITPVNLFATEGQQFKAQVDRITASGAFRYTMTNMGSGATTVFDVATWRYDGRTAEYIAERPTFGNTPTNLTNFGTLTQTTAKTNGIPQDQLPAYQVAMTDSAGLPMASPSNPSGNGYGGFSVNYKNCA